MKAIELEAEQMEQAILYTHAREHWSQTCLTDAGESVRATVRTFMLYATRGRASTYNDVVPSKLTEVTIGLNR